MESGFVGVTDELKQRRNGNKIELKTPAKMSWQN